MKSEEFDDFYEDYELLVDHTIGVVEKWGFIHPESDLTPTQKAKLDLQDARLEECCQQVQKEKAGE